MSHLRATLKLAALILTNLSFYVYLLASSLVVGLAKLLRGDRSGTAMWRTRVFHAWGRWMARLLGMRVEVGGRPPAPPFFLVSNHLGYVDVILLASQLKCVFVAKAEVYGWPVIGRMCASVDTLFIQRELKRDIPRVIQRMAEIMREGRSVIVFPEGTSSGGAGVLPFRPALLEYAARAGMPVYYASISYRTPAGYPPASRVVCWWDDMPFPGHAWKLLALPSFEARLVFGKEPVHESDRKILAARLREEVERRFQPVI